MSGEAYKTVSELALTEDNYDHSLDLLKKKYGKTDILINNFINQLLEIEPVNIKLLRDLYDECEVSIRNLQAIGVASDNFTLKIT